MGEGQGCSFTQAGGEGIPLAGGGGHAWQESCNGDELKDNGKIMSVIRAEMEIKRWNCNGGQ